MRLPLPLLLIKFGVYRDIVVYRFRAVVWSLQSAFWVLVFPVVWLAVYGPREVLQGFTRADIVSYFVGLLIMEYLVESYVDDGMHRDIRDGVISSLLLKPIQLVSYLFYEQIGYRIPRIIIFCSIFLIGSFLFRDYFVFPAHWYTPLLLIPSIILGLLISFNIKVMVGCIAFWLEEAGPFRAIYDFSTTILRGWVGPIVFFPEVIQHISSLLPWQYTLYYPLLIYLENITPYKALGGLAIACIWLFVLVFLRKFVLLRGLRRFNAVGN